MREQFVILNVSLPSVGLNTPAHAVQRKHDICVRANAVCIISNFSRIFCDLSNPCKQLLLQWDMITSSSVSVKHFPSPKMDIAWRNFACLCKVPVYEF